MNGTGAAIRDRGTVQVTFGLQEAEGMALSSVSLGGSLLVSETGLLITGGQASAVSWQKDLDAAYAAAAADPGWVADRLEFGALIEDAYELDENGAG